MCLCSSDTANPMYGRASNERGTSLNKLPLLKCVLYCINRLHSQFESSKIKLLRMSRYWHQGNKSNVASVSVWAGGIIWDCTGRKLMKLVLLTLDGSFLGCCCMALQDRWSCIIGLYPLDAASNFPLPIEKRQQTIYGFQGDEWGGGIDWKFRIDTYTLLYLKWASLVAQW